jgi:hypothetical protein
MARRRILGSVDPTNDNSTLLKKVSALEVQMANVQNQSVGVLSEFNISSDGETLVTQNNSLFVSGSASYLYLNGTDELGQYSIYRLDVRDGGFFVEKATDPRDD